MAYITSKTKTVKLGNRKLYNVYPLTVSQVQEQDGYLNVLTTFLCCHIFIHSGNLSTGFHLISISCLFKMYYQVTRSGATTNYSYFNLFHIPFYFILFYLELYYPMVRQGCQQCKVVLKPKKVIIPGAQQKLQAKYS